MSLAQGIPAEFNKHFAAWLRLEPRCRKDDFTRGLQACTADPLWLLGRQWQTAELAAEDAGSAIDVRVSYATQPLGHVYATQPLGRLQLSAEDNSEPLAAKPLEMLVEQERLALSWRDRVQIGQQFERLIHAIPDLAAATVIKAYREHRDGEAYVFRLVAPELEKDWAEVDRATRRYLRLAEGRVVDGAKILERIDFGDQGSHQLPLLGGITEGQLAQVVSALKAWCRAMNIGPTPTQALAWRNPNLDYRFEIDPPERDQTPKLNLVAPEYRNGELDWHAFNVAGNVPSGWSFDATKGPMLPKRASVGGTSSRWWAFEDAATDFGSIEVSRPDLARLFLMDYVLVHGDDWYVIPFTVRMPRVVCIDKMLVRDVFGDTHEVGPARKANANPRRRFDLFGLSPIDSPTKDNRAKPGIVASTAAGISADGRSLLLIPPVAGYREESPPLEELRFLRDEGANKVWAVEHTVINGLGRPVGGFELQGERAQRLREPTIAERYRMWRSGQEQLSDPDLNLDEAARKRLQDECEALLAEIDRLEARIATGPRVEAHIPFGYHRAGQLVPVCAVQRLDRRRCASCRLTARTDVAQRR